MSKVRPERIFLVNWGKILWKVYSIPFQDTFGIFAKYGIF